MLFAIPQRFHLSIAPLSDLDDVRTLVAADAEDAIFQ